MRIKKENMDSDFREHNAGDGGRKFCMEQNLPGRLIPVPREITAGCGLSWKTAPEARDEVLTALKKAGYRWEAEYVLEL